MNPNLDDTEILCNSCRRSLAAPVNFCPFCGKPPTKKPVHQHPHAHNVADIGRADTGFSEIRQSETPPIPPYEPQIEKNNISNSANHLPEDATSSSPENTHKGPPSASVVTSPSQNLKVGETKKSQVGIYATVVLAFLLAVVGAYELFSAKSSPSKLAEVSIFSTPKGAAVAIDSTDVGDTPHTAANLLAGKHTIAFKKGGYQARNVEISLIEGKNPDIQVTLEKSLQPKGPAVERPRAYGGRQPVSVVKATRPGPTTAPIRQTAPSPAKALEKPMEERIQDAMALYESKQYTAASKQLKAILAEVPNNSVAKYYLQKSVEAGGQ